jgi:hypothetical protein
LVTGRQHRSPSHQNRDHSTDLQTCNGLSFALVQNVGQATIDQGGTPELEDVPRENAIMHLVGAIPLE